MGKIEKILKKGPVEGQTTEVYPVTSTKAVYDENNKRLDNIITGLQESVYLNTPIPISTDNTTESMAQNVKNIADYVEKAKAAGIEDVNGMGVTCIIDDYFSGVGYIMGNTDVMIQGILVPDDLVDNKVFIIFDGRYSERTVIAVGTSNKVDSDMLNEGARKPIILTRDTTEVDEETYQKLLSDDVDVVFKTDSRNLCVLTYKYNDDTAWNFFFTCLSVEEASLGDVYLYGCKVSINDTAPHKVTTETFFGSDIFTIMEDNGFINRYILSPVLQEIDLTGTDADRKAKLDQFAANWKELTGASNLSGARFVGNVSMNDGALTSVLLSYDIDENYSGISMSDDVDESQLKKIVVHPNNGSVASIPLFSHLGAVYLRSGSDSAVLNANKAAIEAYIDNIRNLGIDPDSGYIIPIEFTDRKQDYYGVLFYRNDTSYLNGIVSSKSGNAYCNFTIDRSDGSAGVDLMERLIIEADLFPINTQLKYIETCVKFTEISSSNKSKLDDYLREVPNATVMHCTYKDVYAGTLYKINSDWYGLLVKNTNNPADNINIKLSADGTIIEGNSAQ